VIYAEGPLHAELLKLEDELRFVFITSEASVAALTDAPANAVAGDGFQISVGASVHEKCIRCWHRRADVGAVAEHSEICGRCVDNVQGPGEIRIYA